MASSDTPPSSGRPGPGEIKQGVRPLRPDPLDVDGVVAEDDGSRPELAQLLDQVVDERVVVVENEDPCRHGEASVPEPAGKTRPG